MNMQSLHKHMDEYALWKRSLIREIMRYRTWLARNQLDTPELLKQLEQSIKSLRADHITLAFIGEFSRGKTELINSLFFANFSQRLLPSAAGRTTMCPTEIFFDSGQAASSIQLLPIETRYYNHSITELKLHPERWLSIDLDYSDTDSLIHAFAHIAQTKSVAAEEAIALGFLPDTLEPAELPEHVLIPAWRHALINIDHPLLRQGLRIIDTPGLNALGSEPELTLSLLPQAQAIVFLLSAESGVTASDMAIWQDYVRPHQAAQPTLQFAVLNKIDTLWDSLNHDAFAEYSIQMIQNQTAQILGLQPSQVLPLSAKGALQAKIYNDPELLARSRIKTLEDTLSRHVVAQKEQHLERSIVEQLCTLLSSSQKRMSQRIQLADTERQQLNQQPHSNSSVLRDLLEQAKIEHQAYHSKLLNLKSNQRLLHRQGDILCALMNSHALKNTILDTQKTFTNSWTTLGINRAITDFFKALENNLHAFENEALMANKMIRAIYLRHDLEQPAIGIEIPVLRVKRYRRDLELLRTKADGFRRNIKTLLTEQYQLSRRFFSTLVQEAISQHERIRHDTLIWSNNALTPLIQQNLEQKQLLENHILRLKSLAQSAHSSQQRNQLLNQFISDLSAQQIEAQEILRNISRPAPQRRHAKVVQLATPLTATGKD